MTGFWEDGAFFARHLFTFMVGFYVVWVPGFLLAALLACRFRRPWLESGGQPIRVPIARFASGDRARDRRKRRKEDEPRRHGRFAQARCLSGSCVCLSRGQPQYDHPLLAIFALSLGAEFATGHILGSLVMIAAVTFGLRGFELRAVNLPVIEESQPGRLDLSEGRSWRELVFSLGGWRAVFRFIGREVVSFAPSLAVGILLGGIILAAGLRPWWVEFADVFGDATLSSDVTNAVVAPILSVIAFLSPVGNLPVIHALFKVDGLSYPGIITFCLASVIHPRDIKTYATLFGRKRAWAVSGLLYGGAILGGLGSTGIYALFDFRPSLPPIKIGSKIFHGLLQLLP